MAANRFATLIHRKTNRITLLLVYAFLEWSLIFFILLNSLFSYLILRFADYFGLKPPCLLCSRIDRLFDASGKSPPYRDLLCNDHALEMSSTVRSKPLVESRGFIIIEDEENVGSVRLIDSQEQSFTRDEEETEEKVNEQIKQEGEVSSEDEEFSCYVSSFDCNKEVVTMEAEETAQETYDKPAPQQNLELYIDDQDCHLLPVGFYKPSEDVREISDSNGDFILDFGVAEKHGGLFSNEISAFLSPEESKQDDVERKQDDDDMLQMQNDVETDAEVSIGTEIPDHEQLGDILSHQLIPHDNNVHENETLEFRTIDIETRRHVSNANEERLLETSGSMESNNSMFHLYGRRSLDCMECHEALLTVEKLKSELDEERKALNALYEELEKERSASATAANETMAMINRLHEEKAAMQMEALQYQRMMEEQSEFDQEALQLLNELMVKGEKEKTESEKELEVCRKRLEEYETKEKIEIMMRRMRDDSSVDSDENNGEDDDIENTPVNVVLRLDQCLDDYDGERLSLLERLKFLEDKLTVLNDEEEVKTFESNGSINGKGHFHGKHRVLKSKRLLPLFDAVDGEMDNGDHYENGVDESESDEIVTVEEEVGELYERLEALEADREFLRHCVGSLRKGDKGVLLLNEILQHLRDLKNIDLIRVRDNEDMTL